MEKQIKAVERLYRIHELISKEHTETPDKFAKRLQLSRAHLYRIINILKDYGFPIMYDRNRQTFYYSESFKITVAQIEFSHIFGKK